MGPTSDDGRECEHCDGTGTVTPVNERERVQINFEVDAETKADWEEYIANNPDVPSLAHLLRYSVIQEIDGNESDESESNSASSALELGELLQTVQGIRSDLSVLTTRIGAIERAVERSPEKSNLAQEVWSLLPTAEPGSPEHESLVQQEQYEDIEVVATATVENLAVRLEETESDVRDALTRLQEDTHRIQSEEWHGKDVYWCET